MMTAARKLENAATTLETGTIHQMLGPSLRVRLPDGVVDARRAKSCLVAPAPGDRVLCSVGCAGVHVLAVLDGEAGEGTTIACHGDLRICSETGEISLTSSKRMALRAPELSVDAEKGVLAVEDVGLVSRLVQAEVGRLTFLAQEVDSILGRFSQRAKRVFRFIEGIDQTRAGTIDQRAENLVAIRGENAIISARVLAKIDGEQIHLG